MHLIRFDLINTSIQQVCIQLRAQKTFIMLQKICCK